MSVNEETREDEHIGAVYVSYTEGQKHPSQQSKADRKKLPSMSMDETCTKHV